MKPAIKELKIGIVAGTKEDGITGCIYRLIEVTLAKWLNSTMILTEIPFEKLAKVDDPNFYHPDVDFYCLPFDTSVFGAYTHLLQTAWLDDGGTLILSGKPKQIVVSAINNVLDCDIMVFIATFLSLLVIATIYASSTRSQLRPISHLSKIVTTFWYLQRPFLNQAMPKISKEFFLKILISSWLIFLAFMGNFIGCSLNSKFVTTDHDTIDTISDLNRHKNIKPLMVEFASEYKLVKKMATYDETFADLYNEINKSGGLLEYWDIFSSDGFYTDIHNGRSALIINKLFFWGAFHLVVAGFENDTDLKLYHGTESLSSSIVTNLYNRTLPLFVVEVINHIILKLVETRVVYNRCLAHNLHLVNRYKWRRDSESTFNTQFQDISVVLNLWMYALMFCFGSVILEIFYICMFPLS